MKPNYDYDMDTNYRTEVNNHSKYMQTYKFNISILYQYVCH